MTTLEVREVAVRINTKHTSDSKDRGKRMLETKIFMVSVVDSKAMRDKILTAIIREMKGRNPSSRVKMAVNIASIGRRPTVTLEETSIHFITRVTSMISKKMLKSSLGKEEDLALVRNRVPLARIRSVNFSSRCKTRLYCSGKLCNTRLQKKEPSLIGNNGGRMRATVPTAIRIGTRLPIMTIGKR